MTVDSHLERARSRVRDERSAVERKQAAYRQFVGDVKAVPNDAPAGRGAGPSAVGPAAVGSVATASSTGSRGCATVRERFADTVATHRTIDATGSDAVLETIADELSEGIAVALAPANSTASLTEGLKNQVVSAATTRQHELRVMGRALKTETESLSEAHDALGGVIEWLVEANETPLTECDFDALAARHDRLADHRESCRTVAHERQAVLRTTTSIDATVGLAHRELIGGLYEAFSVDHPVLSTAVRLDELCRECQGLVRDHLVRRA